MNTLIDWLLWVILPRRVFFALPDRCEVCHGKRGGVRGNENIGELHGRRVVMCDYCSVAASSTEIIERRS